MIWGDFHIMEPLYRIKNITDHYLYVKMFMKVMLPYTLDDDPTEQ